MTLDQLKPNIKAVITAIDEDLIPLKLVELGCMIEKSVTFISQAPMGDPICVEIDGNRLAIRKETAKLITVKYNLH